ncbi:ribosomal subunit interface protein [Candidatus Aerophobetes bacterium]|uniref:Ribosomal subunit interface protein n=1 Tax=Aerophobetes bacterium TaxID=2030807 RepID=A0A2A4YDV1_UNCAE|nr:MAG: ribosomal subunit interface protein [Candidatus Aerophobetes bacterium]
MTQKIKLKGIDDEVHVTVVGKNVEITGPLKDYVMEKVKKIEMLNNLIIEIVVRLDVQKIDHSVDIIMKFSHFKVKVHAITHDMYATIDKAFDRLKAKLRKWKGRIQDHHNKGISAIDLKVNVLEKVVTELEEINDQIEEQTYEEVESQLKPPVLHKQKTRVLKTLSLNEAVMKMELSNDNFIVFKCEEDLHLKVLYRRRDDSYGVISLDKESE